MRNLTRRGGLAGLFVAGVLYATGAAAVVVINKDATTVDSIPGLTTFQTFGDMMTGMSVTATFTDAGPLTAIWGATGPGAGGAFDAGWSLVESGDTFSSAWTFSFLSDTLGMLTSLVLDGTPGLTVFDTTEPNTGTDGSAQGLDFVFSGTPDFDVTATYSNIVAIGAADPVGDIFHILSIDFGENGPRTGSFAFLQDTDNDSRLQTPEPGVLGLIGLALIGLGCARAGRRA